MVMVCEGRGGRGGGAVRGGGTGGRGVAVVTVGLTGGSAVNVSRAGSWETDVVGAKFGEFWMRSLHTATRLLRLETDAAELEGVAGTTVVKGRFSSVDLRAAMGAAVDVADAADSTGDTSSSKSLSWRSSESSVSFSSLLLLTLLVLS